MSNASFPSVDRATWRAQVAAELKGRDPDRALLRRTEDGLPLQPLYLRGDSPEAPGEAAGVRPVGPLPWTVEASYAGAGALDALRTDLDGGVTGVRIDADACSIDRLPDLPDAVWVELTGGDPTWLAGRPHASLALAAADPRTAELLAAGRTVSLSSEGWARGGATGTQEVGWLLAALLHAVRVGRDAGASGAATQLHATITVGREVFPSIARIRALRILWRRSLKAWGLDAPPLRIRAVTHPGVYTARDPWVNLLRGSHGAFAAIAAGADAIEVLPLDAAVGQPDALSRRMARNTSQILGLESHLGRVRDPAAGSWFLEQLTQQTVAAGWAAFQSIGGDLGLPARSADGTLIRMAGQAQAERQEAIADRRLPITGVSEFPDAAPPLLREGATRAGGDGAAWEALRDRVEGTDARVFVATWGPRPEWNARATWIENLLRAGGFTPVVHEGGEPESLVDAWRASGAEAVCLCASDARYIQAAEVAEALRGAGAPILLLAGKAGRDTENADLDLLLHHGAPVLERLTALAATVLDPAP